jgi:predicted ATPase
VSLQLKDDETENRFPFTIPALRGVTSFDLNQPVTFLVGENGSGKSTFMEALAWALQAVTVGSEPLDRDPTLEHVRPLGEALRPIWNTRVRRGFFSILMALPGAKILSFDETPIAEVAYDDLEHVRITRGFLNHPGRFLRHL